MEKSIRRWISGLAVGFLSLFFLYGMGQGNSAETKGLFEAIDKLAGLAATDPVAMQKEANKLASTVDVEEAMKPLAKRTKGGKGGMGVGPEATGLSSDGIEARILNLSKKALTAEQLREEEAVLVQMANRNAVVGALSLARTPTKKEKEKTPEDWKEYSEQMIQQSFNLARAVKAHDPAEVKKTARLLNESCTNCHGKFRD